MAAQSSQNMDDSYHRAHSADSREFPHSDDEAEEDNPGIPHGPDRATQVQLTHQEASEKLKTLVADMTSILQAHGLSVTDYLYALSMTVLCD
jgi:hypothetical protein